MQTRPPRNDDNKIMKVFVNEKIVDEKKAVVSVFDRGLLYGDGIFETMRAYGGRVFMLDEHIERLYNSAGIIDLNIRPDKKYIKYIIYRLLKVNRLSEAYIRLSVSRGTGRVGLDATTAESDSVVIIVKDFTPYPDKFYRKGVRLYTSSVRRNERSVLFKIKSLNYLNNIIARLEAQAAGATDALLLNSKDKVAESAVSNIFMVKKNLLVTPSIASGALPGITREAVLSLAGKAGLRPVQRQIGLRELKGANEIFLTNTLMEIMPVTRLDKKTIANGAPGPVTKKLHKAYKALTRGL